MRIFVWILFLTLVFCLIYSYCYSAEIPMELEQFMEAAIIYEPFQPLDFKFKEFGEEVYAVSGTVSFFYDYGDPTMPFHFLAGRIGGMLPPQIDILVETFPVMGASGNMWLPTGQRIMQPFDSELSMAPAVPVEEVMGMPLNLEVRKHTGLRAGVYADIFTVTVVF